MKILDALNVKAQDTFQHGDEYLKSSEKYIKLKIFEQLSLTLSFLIKFFIILGLGFAGLFFVSVAGAIALGEWLNSMPLACLIIGITLILLMGLAFAFRRRIDNTVISNVSDNFFNSDKDEKEI
ncbi:hypothetical protein [Aestuariibaculum lutulentum]|uniref:Phage holin family protein n=1 Tax=Aestuariibaculum lutulentum TaxID=2920935 RepID=A0ABS9RFM8_9FLAO|nr:hypothetical protein [Aestuariibaculum lutulentum]MCH4551750.1 hypothetical protein [Aestuariibaculum lutulentum]